MQVKFLLRFSILFLGLCGGPAIIPGEPDNSGGQLDLHVEGRHTEPCTVRRAGRPLAVGQHRHHAANRACQFQGMIDELAE